MTQSIFKTVKTSVKNWWVHLLIGILFVIVTWVMFTPLASYIGLSIFFSVVIFIWVLWKLYLPYPTATRSMAGDGSSPQPFLIFFLASS